MKNILKILALLIALAWAYYQFWPQDEPVRLPTFPTSQPVNVIIYAAPTGVDDSAPLYSPQSTPIPINPNHIRSTAPVGQIGSHDTSSGHDTGVMTTPEGSTGSHDTGRTDSRSE